jgi:acetyl-CoA decarbonylase/synthase complex subunit delta
MILKHDGIDKIEVKVNRFSLDLESWNPPLLALTVPLDPAGIHTYIFKARGLETSSIDKLALDLHHRFNPDILCVTLPRHGEPRDLEDYVEICLSIIDRIGKPLMILGEGSAFDRMIFEGIVEKVGADELIIGPVDIGNYRTYAALASIYKQNLLARSTTDINQAKQLIQLIVDAGLPREHILLDIASTGLGLGLEDTYNLVEQAKLLYGRGDPLLSIPIAAFTWEAWDSPEIYMDGLSIYRGMVWELISASAYILASADLIVLLDPEAFLHARRLIGMLSTVG